jgi:hypothetical protein
LAPPAWVLIASMPFSALAFVAYPWLAAMISPVRERQLRVCDDQVK